MRSVVIITHVDFWRQGAGHCARILALVSYLARYTRLTVVYAGTEQKHDPRRLDALGLDFRLVFLEREKELSPGEYAGLLRHFLAENTFHVCIIEFLELSFVRDYLPAGTKVLLDTHDIVSDRNKSFAQYNAPGATLAWEQELELFGRYDAVMLINRPDYEKVSRHLGADKSILVPHAPPARRRVLREKAARIGFVASAYPPNVDAITHFTRQVWPRVKPTGVQLVIYGMINRVFMSEDDAVVARGFVPDLAQAYDEIDIVINPVRFGAGLKIKNMEALSNGLPLVTTRHGATGLEEGAGTAFLVADEPAEFAGQLTGLVGDYERRRQLGENASRFCRQYFSPQACYGDLLAFINNA